MKSKLVLGAVLLSAACAMAGEVVVTADFGAVRGKVKQLNGTNAGPSVESADSMAKRNADFRERAASTHYAVVRETHDGRFYFAAFTVKKRTVDLKLDFLGEGDWTMSVFADDPELTPADAKELDCGTRRVRKGGSESFGLLDEGGAVAIFEKSSK